jgi:hypothetical protein
MPIQDVISALRAGKESLRRSRRQSSLDDKLMEVYRLQHIQAQISRFRQVHSTEPWDLMSDVRDTVVIEDGAMKSVHSPNTVTSSQSWVRPFRPWVLARE